MYLNIGGDRIVRDESIIAIIDIDKATTDKITREFLKSAETEKKVVSVSEEIPKSFLVVKENHKDIVYISPLSPQTLLKRIQKEA